MEKVWALLAVSPQKIERAAASSTMWRGSYVVAPFGVWRHQRAQIENSSRLDEK
jgi:hypothetical protein